MTSDQLLTMAARIHDLEGWELGARSSRETRNAFLERVIGCAYWGHPAYNLFPDPQWHCKDPDGPGGRPASDDVAVSMPSRRYWDLIPGAGADGYRFQSHYEGALPAEQFVFVPSKPQGSGLPQPDVPPPAKPNYPGDAFIRAALGAVLAADYAARPQAMDDGSVVWAFRVIWDHLREGLDLSASIQKQRFGPHGWRKALGLTESV